MGDESSKKRKRRRRSKERTEDDGEVPAKQVPEEPEVKEVHDNSDVEEAEPEQSDVKVKDEQVDEEDDEKDADDDEPKKRKRKRKRKNKASSEIENTSTTKQEPTTPADTTSHTVFIEGLPFTSTQANVRYFFEQHGCSDIVEMRLPTWQDSGRLRGFGHVVFRSLDTKEKALNEVNGKELGGRYVTVQEAKAPRAGTSAGECSFKHTINTYACLPSLLSLTRHQTIFTYLYMSKARGWVQTYAISQRDVKVSEVNVSMICTVRTHVSLQSFIHFGFSHLCP